MSKNEETISEKPYVPFYRERTQPIDKYTRAEVDKKLDDLKKLLLGELEKVKADFESQRDRDLKDFSESWKARLNDFDERFKLFYTQDKIDHFFEVQRQHIDNLSYSLSKEKQKFDSLQDVVVKYLVDAGLGTVEGNHFVFHKKKKRLWKK